ncbi:hypothetical protein SKAU_G00202660 [Synaphobranchus kaupii]|uniref:Uncharacterized protein n=1 Tax=Synaphobranchus kaupii TaxID=118154 RepID=A0A9Q1IW93_SYNKA|nr:hypothetical protein SKAU_G00202660 [Synaphobranchus kaupii]
MRLKYSQPAGEFDASVEMATQCYHHVRSSADDPAASGWTPRSGLTSRGCNAQQTVPRVPCVWTETEALPASQATAARGEVLKNLLPIKEILYGTSEKEVQMEAASHLAQELNGTGLLGSLISDLLLVDFQVGEGVKESEGEA